MADYTLHCFLESGNAYKTALMLQLAGADWEPEWVNFFKGEHRSPEYLAINSMGEVPTLVDHTQGDIAISQSGVQLWHLADRFEQFAARNAQEHREVLRWILFDNHKLTGNIATFRFLNKFMGKGETPEGEFTKARMIQAIKMLDRHLKDRDWTVGDRVTVADLSMVGYLMWPDHYGVTWDDYPNIKAWLERIQALPNFATPEEILPSGPKA
ncbi:MAG: glutathione S-transferase family protein [Pseudomonadota bacterium]